MASFNPPIGLEFCCDYMTSFSPGSNLKLRRRVKRISKPVACGNGPVLLLQLNILLPLNSVAEVGVSDVIALTFRALTHALASLARSLYFQTHQIKNGCEQTFFVRRTPFP